jgi:CheY-like chemotaxis protein
MTSVPHGGFFSVDSLRGVWILVVASDPLGRQTLVDILAYCGALVTPIASVDDALGIMRQVKPDLLITAVGDDDDLDFIRRVRRLKPEDGGVVPAIAIARGDTDDVLRSRGFQACLRAPLDPWEMCRLVSSLLTVRC